MTSLEIIGLVVVGVVFVLLILSAMSKFFLHIMKGPLEARIASHYGQDEILLKDLKANSFGVESAGVWQLRGNGGLVLTGKNLHFFMFVPKSDLCVLLDTITELTITKSHLGKTTPYDLLKVHYCDEGTMDSIAWYLTDPRAWKLRIEGLKAGTN
mgnify:CR=1 FL=1